MASERTAVPPAPRRAAWGGWVIVALVGLGLVGAAVAVGFYARLQARPLGYWGVDRARLIVRAPRVALGRLERTTAPGAGQPTTAPADATAPAGAAPPAAAAWTELAIDGQTFRVTGVREVADAPGFSHLRAALVNDFSYAWDAVPAEASGPEWDYALRFEDAGAACAVLLDTRGGWVRAADGGRPLAVRPIAGAIRTFVGGP